MEFQIIDWFCRDEKSNRLVDDNTINEGYVIHLFGCNEQGESVHAKIKNFKPYFFIKVPKWFKKRHVEILQDFLKQEIYYKHRENIVSCQLQKRTDFNGYHPEPEKFVVVHFHNLGAFYSLKRMFKDGQMIKTIPELTTSPIRFNSYEANLDPMLRFIHVTNIQPAGWVQIDKYKNGKIANTKIDIETDWMHVHPHENEYVAPLKQASFDIECTAGDGVSFPEYTNINDPVIQIGTTVYVYGQDNSKPLKHIICLGKTDPIEGAIVESYETEKEVLLAWTKFIRKLDPDIITGYNIYGFDFRYLYERAKLLGIEEKFSLLGRLRGEQSVLQEKKLSSSALGFNEMHILPMIGRLEIDLFKVIQRDYKFESYKLDAVSAEFIKGKISDIKQTKTFTNIVTNPNGLNVGNYISILANGYKYVNPSDGRKKFKILAIKGDRVRIEKIEKPEGKLQWCLAKDDVSPKDIFRLQKGSSEDRCVVARYCLQDNILCNELMDKLDIIVNHIGMANVCYVPMNFLFLRGQGIKAYSLVARQCRLEKYLIPDLRKTRDSEYQGATVLEAQVGGHFYPVACNDFASLYPSSMISHNLSPDTLITKPEDLKNVPHQTIEISANEKYHFLLPEETSEEDKHNPEVQRNRKGRGILPRILIHLLQSRKDVKKRMAKETNPFKKSLLDGLQLSYKLTCNSIYGQCGSSVSAIACKPVSASTTAIGRELLEFAGDQAKKTYPGTELVYGDSVLPTTMVTVKKDNQIYIKEIQEIADTWIPKYIDIKTWQRKEQSYSEYQILGSEEFVDIRRVIRHKTKKKIYKISTSSSYVEVTEDHSLLDENKNLIKPSECKIGTKLLMNPNKYENISFPSNKIQNHYEHFLKNPSNKVTNIELLYENYDGYVYDIETSEGVFQAGLGNLVVKNTDSIFCKYPIPETCKTKKEKLEYAMKCAKVVENVVSTQLPWPHNLEYEKIYYPYILYSKKRYSGVMYEFDLDNYSKIDNKGIVLKRRDNAKIVKYIFGGCLNIILFEHDVEKALKFMYKSVEEMFQGKFDIGMFIISKALKVTKTVPAHKMLADRMAKRDPGNAPQLNDRIPYVYVYVDKETTRDMLNEYNKDIVEKTKKRKKLLQGDLIEHPEYVQQNNLKFDYLFYLTNQLTNPLTQLFGIFENIGQTEFKDIEEEIKLKEKAFTKRVMKPLERKYKNRQDGIQTLDVFFKKK